jgi:hypothetical protein
MGVNLRLLQGAAPAPVVFFFFFFFFVSHCEEKLAKKKNRINQKKKFKKKYAKRPWTNSFSTRSPMCRPLLSFWGVELVAKGEIFFIFFDNSIEISKSGPQQRKKNNMKKKKKKKK